MDKNVWINENMKWYENMGWIMMNWICWEVILVVYGILLMELSDFVGRDIKWMLKW